MCNFVRFIEQNNSKNYCKRTLSFFLEISYNLTNNTNKKLEHGELSFMKLNIRYIFYQMKHIEEYQRIITFSKCMKNIVPIQINFSSLRNKSGLTKIEKSKTFFI